MTQLSNPNSTNAFAMKFVRLLATRSGVAFSPFPADPARPYASRPSHIYLDGVGGRVVARHAEASDPHSFLFDKLLVFRDIKELVAVCLPSSDEDDPVIYRIPESEWASRSSIRIEVRNPSCRYAPYRWTPQTRQETRWLEFFAEHCWDICDGKCPGWEPLGPLKAERSGPQALPPTASPTALI
ncbi:hypothetical protein ACFSR9_13100 [Deinococcus taklimakanensis]|uniref:Uncharacterized protein n=1 Tax=Deinococcus taklimakanensis TaxID=536443 RepID=A0ABW5P594_9DEIO